MSCGFFCVAERGSDLSGKVSTALTPTRVKKREILYMLSIPLWKGGRSSDMLAAKILSGGHLSLAFAQQADTSLSTLGVLRPSARVVPKGILGEGWGSEFRIFCQYIQLLRKLIPFVYKHAMTETPIWSQAGFTSHHSSLGWLCVSFHVDSF